MTDKSEEFLYDIRKELKILNHTVEIYSKLILETLIHMNEVNKELAHAAYWSRQRNDR